MLFKGLRLLLVKHMQEKRRGRGREGKGKGEGG